MGRKRGKGQMTDRPTITRVAVITQIATESDIENSRACFTFSFLCGVQKSWACIFWPLIISYNLHFSWMIEHSRIKATKIWSGLFFVWDFFFVLFSDWQLLLPPEPYIVIFLRLHSLFIPGYMTHCEAIVHAEAWSNNLILFRISLRGTFEIYAWSHFFCFHPLVILHPYCHVQSSSILPLILFSSPLTAINIGSESKEPTRTVKSCPFSPPLACAVVALHC